MILKNITLIIIGNNNNKRPHIICKNIFFNFTNNEFKNNNNNDYHKKILIFWNLSINEINILIIKTRRFSRQINLVGNLFNKYLPNIFIFKENQYHHAEKNFNFCYFCTTYAHMQNSRHPIHTWWNWSLQKRNSYGYVYCVKLYFQFHKINP